MKNEKKKKGGKFPPKGDTTQKRRQSRRREKLNEIAKAHGFASWSAYETAVINGMARLTKRAADGAICPCCQSNNTFEAVICVNCGAHTAPRR